VHYSRIHNNKVLILIVQFCVAQLVRSAFYHKNLTIHEDEEDDSTTRLRLVLEFLSSGIITIIILTIKVESYNKCNNIRK
jgi:hypothetical protein